MTLGSWLLTAPECVFLSHEDLKGHEVKPVFFMHELLLPLLNTFIQPLLVGLTFYQSAEHVINAEVGHEIMCIIHLRCNFIGE